jgi:hypothetical protein
MTTNSYRLQGKNDDEYYPSNRRQINRMIEAGQAEWVGTDPGPGEDEVTHYADRIRA